MSYVEPWMRGHLSDLDPVIAALLYSFQHAREDLDKWTAGLSDELLWAKAGDVASVGFQIRHIAGSIDRLITYAKGEQLSDEQMMELKREKDDTMPRDQLFALLDERMKSAEAVARQIDPAQLGETRYIGRKRVPVPLAGLLVHVAEHTQRHVGEALITTKIVREQHR